MILNGTDRVERGMAEMQQGDVIMDVVNADQAKIAEKFIFSLKLKLYILDLSV